MPTATCSTSPGLYELSFEGQHYTLSIPQAYSPDKPSPFILALHYAGHGSPYYSKAMITELIGPAFQSLDAIILAPDCSAADWLQPQSEADVLALLDHIESSYAIDPHRKLVTGYSMGAMGAWHWAAARPKRFSAAIVMAGNPPQNYLEIEWKTPIFVLHSHQDELMPIQASQKAVEQLQHQGADITMRALDGITHFEVYRYISPLRELIPWLQQKWG
jgi:predicted peptidase